MTRKKAIVQGRFYPNNKDEIFSFISQHYLADISLKDKGRIILSPHAGYSFSGCVAAKAFSHLADDFETALIIGTAHTTYLDKCALMKDFVFENSIGEVRSDDDIADELLKSGFFEDVPRAFSTEHSVEVQIPFLQFKKKNFKIVPVVVNNNDKKLIDGAGKTIAEIMRKNDKVVVVISSDLSHYPAYEIAYVSDNALALSYEFSSVSKDVDYFILSEKLLFEKYKKKLDTVACGFVSMAIGLKAAIELGFVFKMIEYINSGDVNDMMRDEVVGYLGGLFCKEDKEFKFNLSDEEKKFLLHIARMSIEGYLKDKKELKLDYIQYPKLNLPCAVFVTLTLDGNLRGCIGSLTPHMLMADAVSEYAIKAAFDDPRFEPVSFEEFKRIKIEISLLSPLKRIKDLSEIKENLHGVYVKRGLMSATYLPQVWEHFSNKKDFLKSLMNEKSSIGYHNISDPQTEIYIYTVEKIKE
ncbi:MAG: AmmeMemoRadiSam system protein B [Elusimicrobiales bacterium]